ncbi:MAG: hypothetical protein ABMB14_24540, partial [Myxococcota bacterium]
MPGTFDLGPSTLDVDAAGGAAVAAWVGDAADPLRYDPIAAEGVRLAPVAAGAHLHAPLGVTFDGRIE